MPSRGCDAARASLRRGGRYPGPGAVGAPPLRPMWLGAGASLGRSRFGDPGDLIDRRRLLLDHAARPANLQAVDLRRRADPEVQAQRALAGVAVAAVHLANHGLAA